MPRGRGRRGSECDLSGVQTERTLLLPLHRKLLERSIVPLQSPKQKKQKNRFNSARGGELHPDRIRRNMGEVSPSAVPVKFKRRSASAIRDFPRGCGPHAVRDSLKPSEETPTPSSVKVSGDDAAADDLPKLGEAGTSLDRGMSVGSSLKVPKPEPEGLVEPAKDLGNLGPEAKKVEDGEGTKGFPEPIVKLESLELLKENLVRSMSLGGPKTDEGVEKQSFSKKYGPPKRRRVSATRDFPVGCGGNAPRMSKEEPSEVAAASCTENKALDGEKKPEVNQQPMVEDAVGVAAIEKAESELRRNDGEQLQENVVEELSEKKFLVRSASEKKLEGRDMKQPVLEGSIKVAFAEKVEDEVKRDEGKQIREKVQEISIGAQVKSASKSGQEIKGEALVKPVSGYSKVKSLDGEGKPTANQHRKLEGSVRVASAEKVGGEVKRDGDKKIPEEVQGSRSVAQVESASKSGLNENIVEEKSEKKILVRSTSEKKSEGCDMKQASNNLQNKEPRLDAKPQSGSKLVVKEGRNLMGKPGDKGSAKQQQKDPKNLKRKLSEEIDDGGRIVEYQTQGNESLEAYGSRLVVQALMSAENCPWRKDKKFGGSSSLSVTTKNKAKKFVLKESSSSQHKNEVDVEDEEDSMPQDDGNEKALTIYKRSLPRDYGNEKACTINKRSRELTVTVTPSVPPKLNHKGAADSEDIIIRNKVKKTLRLFQVICRKLLQGEEAKLKQLGKKGRVDLQASSILKEKNEWVNHGKQPILGDLPGVEVGDEFHYRAELSIIGLHRPFQGGIDYMKKDGKIFATSIVASGGYPDDMDSSDVLIYSGSGGNPEGGDKQPGDQKLERGNLALKNSIDAKTPVRVIHGFKEKGNDSRDARSKIVRTFIYDGLYIVERYWQEKGAHGYNVFKFQLRRMPGQPELALQEAKKSKKSKVREGLCSKDISQGKEIMPICAVNTVDNDHPMPFKYITKTIYPSWYVQKPPRGCDCTDGCSDSENCACAVKNGGEIPFNFNGSIVQAKPLVYECGPSCKCPPSCHNRVGQHGMKIPLEIFKTKSRGWGVRSLYSITSGSFICEYVGEMLQDTEAERRSNDEYLFDIGHNYDDHTLWEGLPTLIPELRSSSACETVEDVGFTIDAAEYGNVGRFINHSCTPNLYAQNVLYDHDDKRMPHIAFFAVDNIPPLQELTYHYNYTLDQVRDSEGNIKQKDCFCGSPECTGRLY